MKKVIIIAAVVCLVLLLIFRDDGTVSLGPGVFAPEEPVQSEIDDPEPFEKHGLKLTPLADYSIEAKILSKCRYRGSSNDARLSPVDFALGWGRMSDEEVLSQIDIGQNGRFYYWRSSTPPIPVSEIIRSSANTHLIPADERVRDVLLGAKTGSIVSISGKLVKATGAGGWKWKSSLRRNDTGDGACEIIYVEFAFVTKAS